MIGRIAAFELRYQLRSPTFWVALFLFFCLGFFNTASDSVQISVGAIHENSPMSLGILQGMGSVMYLLVVTAFAANTIVRDDTSGFAPIVRATPVSENQMLFGRFLGGFLVAALGFLAVPIGAFLGTLMPWVDPELIGPQVPAYYLWPYLTLALPNILLASAFLFMLATITRSMMWSYVGVVFFFVAYTITTSVLARDPSLRETFALYEPMGIGAFGTATRYWTVAEQNSRLMPLEGNFLLNRLMALGYTALFLAITAWRFNFAEKPASKRTVKKLAKRKAREESLAAVAPQLGGEAISAKGREISRLDQFLARLGLEVKMILKSPGLIVLVLIAVGLLSGNLWGSSNLYGNDEWPTVAATITMVRMQFGLFMIIIASFYAGEAVWRERDHKIGEIVDSAPVPAWLMTVTKILGVSLVLALVTFVGMLTGIVYQLTGGNPSLELGHYVTWLLLPGAFDFLFMAAFAVIVQVLSPNKYVGWGVILAWFLGNIVLASWGLTNPLYNYADGPGVPLSDMVDPGPFMLGSWSVSAYWAAIAVLLMVAAHLLWPRGTDLSLKQRIARLKRAGVPRSALAVGLAALVAAIGIGAFVHYNIKVLNEYRTQDEDELLRAAFERKYEKYIDLPQPTAIDVKLDVDLFPDERRMVTKGRYVLKNPNAVPIEEIHVLDDPDSFTIESLEIAGAELASFDEEFHYRIYKLAQPLAPGATTTMDFTTQVWKRGFTATGAAASIMPDATFMNSSNFTPRIGMSDGAFIKDRQARRRQGLSDERRPAKLEDDKALMRSALGGLAWTHTDITLTTDADQVPLAPGNKVSDTVEGDRRTARFVATAPILQFYSILSADYEVATRKHGDLDFSVYYHEGHDWNVPRMLDAMGAALDYYQANFGPYQFDHARIVEFPGYATFAQAFAGTMPYSEAIGFTTKLKDKEDTDFITYVIAHELAHQYWAHQVLPGDMQGAALTTETLASYSALMVMKKLLGPDQQRRFLKYELDGYLRGRKGEQIEELPLIRMENQAYIHYRKGGHTLALLAERMGEDKVNAALANFVKKYQYQTFPFHRSTDLVTELRAVATTPEEQQLITDIFEKIVLFDMRVTDAKSEKVGDEWRTTLTIDAKKFEVDGKGNETAVEFDEPVEVGLFSARPGYGAFDESDVIRLEKRRIGPGKATIVLTSKKRPAIVGIDPYNRYIDRNSDDNLKDVTVPKA